jgi:hypothetical protein
MRHGTLIAAACCAACCVACDYGPDECGVTLPAHDINVDATHPEDSMAVLVESSTAEYSLQFEYAGDFTTGRIDLRIRATGDNAADVTIDPDEMGLDLTHERRADIKVACHGAFPCRAQFEIISRPADQNRESVGALSVGVRPKDCHLNPPDYHVSMRQL